MRQSLSMSDTYSSCRRIPLRCHLRRQSNRLPRQTRLRLIATAFSVRRTSDKQLSLADGKHLCSRRVCVRARVRTAVRLDKPFEELQREWHAAGSLRNMLLSDEEYEEACFALLTNYCQHAKYKKWKAMKLEVSADQGRTFLRVQVTQVINGKGRRKGTQAKRETVAADSDAERSAI